MAEQSNSDIAAQNRLEGTTSTGESQIPNPIPPDSPAAIGGSSFTSGINDMSGSNPTTPNTQTPMAPPAGTPGLQQPPYAQQASPASLQQAQARQQQRQQQPPPTPQQLHTSIFHNVLGVLAGGGNRPVIGPNGQPQTDANGNVVMQPMTKKALGASILAGALSGMMAGMAAPSKFNEVAPGRFQQDYSGSLAAGMQAGGQFTQKGRMAEAQGQADEQKTRAYATMDHNLKLHASILGNEKLQGEAMNEGVQQDSPLIEAMKLNPTITDAKGNVLQAIKGEHVSATALHKMMQDKGADVTMDSVLRDGTVDVMDGDKPALNSDGTQKKEYTYTVYDHKAQIALTEKLKADFPELKYVLPGTSVSMAVLGKYNVENTNLKNAQGFVNQWAGQVAEHNDKDAKPINIKSAVSKDPYLRKLIPQLGRYAGMEPDQAMNQMDKDGVDPALIGKFGELLGGIDRQKWSLERADKVLEQKNTEAEKKARELADQKRMSPEGQQDLLHKQLENQALMQTAAQLKASQEGIDVPKNFTPNPRAVSLAPGDLSKDLTSKGVKLPSNFNALYTIGHNAAKLETITNSPRKGSGVMPRDQALTFIRTFINPQYQEGDYAANAKLQADLENTGTGKAGGTMLAAGTATGHLEMLAQAGDALKNKNLQAYNSLKARYGVAVGEKDPVLFKAIVQKLNEEVEKVTSGGTPMEASLKQSAENLNVSQAPEQIDAVIRGYIGLMNGRISEIDDRSHQYTGRHIPVSANMVRVFNKYGYMAPGQPAGSHAVVVKGEVVGYTVDGKTMTPAPAPVH